VKTTSTSGHRPGPGNRPPGDTHTSANPDSKCALERLAATLSKADFSATVTGGDNGTSVLTVVNRHAQLGETIYADEHCYWWPWGQPIAAVANPQAAAAKVSYVLAAAPCDIHG
jgi:hypothetical protein